MSKHDLTEPSPQQCADKARAALEGDALENDAPAAISDAITNLVHLAEALGENPIKVVASALGHWGAERDNPDGPPWNVDIELHLGRRELTAASFQPSNIDEVKWIP